MSLKRKKACSGAPEQAVETAALSGAAISGDYSILSTGRIESLLSSGRANAVPLGHLCTITGLDGRTVRQMIASERLHGVPILSDNVSGYFLPANDGEREQFVRSMRNRAKEIMRAADAVEKAGV